MNKVNLPKVTLLSGLFVLTAYATANATQYLAPRILPNTVRRLSGDGGLLRECRQFGTWYGVCFAAPKPPMQRGASCRTCYERSIGAAPRCSSAWSNDAGDVCSVCASSMTDQNAAHRDLRNGVDTINARFAQQCATRSGGYFYYRNNGPRGLEALGTDGYTLAEVCPGG